MATISVYNRCIQENIKYGVKEFHTGSYKPNLKGLFGVKKLVSKRQFDGCCESEKRRHLYEDSVIRLLYIKENFGRKESIKRINILTRHENV